MQQEIEREIYNIDRIEHPYQHDYRFRVSYNHHSRRFIMKLDNMIFEKQNVRSVVVVQYNVHREKMFYPKCREYPFHNLPSASLFIKAMKNNSFKNYYIKECEFMNMDNRIKNYEFMIIINESFYIISEYGQHNGAYIEICDMSNLNNETKTKFYITETYAKNMYNKIKKWLKLFPGSTTKIKTIDHPVKNKRITSAICSEITSHQRIR
tara:strand:+ start:1515 stop:2141 length:627 start_codon:yes stop_codon:yes gene_type:complete